MEPDVLVIGPPTHFITYLSMTNGGADRVNAFLADPRILVLRKHYEKDWNHWMIEYMVIGG